MSNALAGLGVLVTRPKEQAPPLCQAILQAGGTPIAAPMIEIAWRPITAPDIALLHQADIIIVTSANAVPACPPNCPPGYVIAIGPATALALETAGWSVDYTPPAGHTSEDLLQAECLKALFDQKVVIIGGEKPRGLLQAALKAQGAQVETLSLYRRLCPTRPSVETLPVWSTQAVVITSLECFRNLVHWLGPQGTPWLSQQAICAPSQRIADTLHALPFLSCVLQAESPQDDAIVDCLAKWWTGIR